MSTSPTAPAAESTDPDRKRLVILRLAKGFILGVLISLAVGRLGLSGGGQPLFTAALAAAIGVTRFQQILWIAAAGIVATLLLVAYTPIVGGLMRPLQKATN